MDDRVIVSVELSDQGKPSGSQAGTAAGTTGSEEASRAVEAGATRRSVLDDMYDEMRRERLAAGDTEGAARAAARIGANAGAAPAASGAGGGGGGGGAAGGAAAASGGIPWVAIGETAVALAGLIAPVEILRRAFIETARVAEEAAQFSPLVAAQSLENQVRQIERTRDRALELQGEFAAIVAAQGDLAAAMDDIRTVVVRELAPFLTAGIKLATEVVEDVANVLKLLEAIAEFTGVNKLIEILSQLDVTVLDAVGGPLNIIVRAIRKWMAEQEQGDTPFDRELARFLDPARVREQVHPRAN